MRTIILFAIVLLIAFGASAQEGQERKQQQFVVPPQQVQSDAVTLSVIGNTPPGKNDLTHKIVFPKSMTRDEAIDACAKELAEFLKHKFPDQVELKARVAMCVVPEVMGEAS